MALGSALARIAAPLLAALLLQLTAGGGPEPGAAAPERCWPGPPGSDPARCPPDDPRWPRHWEYRGDLPREIDRTRMHPAEAALGAIGMSLDRAWQQTTGRDDVTIAVLDSGIRWNDRDLVRKLALNTGELPPPLGSETHDANGDGRVDVTDWAADPRVGDRNANGLLDAQDLIRAFSDCVDDDANGWPDDICGWDAFAPGLYCGTVAGDNDAADDTDFGHGTGIAKSAAAETNNGLDDVGACPGCRVLPVRVGDTFVVDANQFARGTVFAARRGAEVIASALGSYNNTPASRYALDLAYALGTTVIASAADEFSYHHNFPSVHDHALYVNAIRGNHAGDWRRASTFWGVNPCTNWGARVWVTVPAESCSSGATSRLAGVAGLVISAGRDGPAGELHPEEVYQLLRATADDLDTGSPDWSSVHWPARPGFDELYGYGRVHAERAVRAAGEGRVPPRADLTSPRWFAVIAPDGGPLPVRGSIGLREGRRASWRLEYALGVEPAEADWRRVAAGETESTLEGTLGVLDFTELPRPHGPPPRDRDTRDRFTVSLRLHVADGAGLSAEARRSFYLFRDPDALPHFPVDLAASGEAAPVLADLDADGRDEIVLPTADGLVRIYAWEAEGLRRTELALDGGPPLDPVASLPAAEARALGRESVMRAAAIGDLLGAGRPAIVVATREGRVHAFDARGERLAGFPVSLPPEAGADAAPDRPVERGFLARPVLADLDGRPGLEILLGGLDGRVWAWRGDGRPLAGFPVRLARADGGGVAKIVSTPAAGDLDGDGRTEIVVGSNAVEAGRASAWAFTVPAAGEPARFLPGWRPLGLAALRGDLLPTVASGVQMDPVLVDADGDGDDEVVLYAVTGTQVVLVDHSATGPRIVARHDTRSSSGSALASQAFLGGTGSALVADTDGDGRRELYAPLLPLRLLTLRSKPGVPLDVPLALGGWPLGGEADAGTGRVPMLAGWPRRMEDLMLLARPAAADVDGDGVEEVLMGSGGWLLHAFSRGGGEAVGWPRFTGGWIFSAPATGDVDGDGRLDVVSVTREGYLFAWRSGGSAGTNSSTRKPPATAKRDGAKDDAATGSPSRANGS